MYLSPLTSSGRCANIFQDHRPQDSIAGTPKKDPDRVVIPHEHLLYGIIMILGAIIIDKKLLIPVIAALALVISVLPVFTPLTDVERLFDLSAFRVDWKPKVEIIDHDVIKEIKKPVEHVVTNTVYIDKPIEVVKEVEVIKEVEKPVDREVVKLVPEYIVKTETVHKYIVKTEVVNDAINHYRIKDDSSKKPIYHDAEVPANPELEPARLPP
jgi:hypothetical protein